MLDRAVHYKNKIHNVSFRGIKYSLEINSIKDKVKLEK